MVLRKPLRSRYAEVGSYIQNLACVLENNRGHVRGKSRTKAAQCMQERLDHWDILRRGWGELATDRWDCQCAKVGRK